MTNRPTGRGDAFEKLMSTKLCVQFTLNPHKVVGIFNKSGLHLDLARLGVTRAGSGCHMKGVKIGC